MPATINEEGMNVEERKEVYGAVCREEREGRMM